MAAKIGSISSPSYVKSIQQDSKPIQLTAEDIKSLNESVDFSSGDWDFKFDPINYPLKSTQQLNVDWSKFENHTFFSSAEVKVNEAFNLIINNFPFDGTKKEIQTFLDKLTGFEKYVYDNFPVWSGALQFSGTKVGEDFNGTKGSWISVKDKSGYLYPDISKNNKGEVIINPDASGSISIETLVYLPSIANSTQVICQKQSSPNDGFTLYLSPDASTSYVTASFSISSGSSKLNTSAVLKKGAYNHICVAFNREENFPDANLQFYVNEKLISTSSNVMSFGKLDIDNSDFLIGTGSAFYYNNSLVTPTQTFSGTLDEFRLFHSVRSVEKQKLYFDRGIYSTPDLKLYYRFNEPPPLLSLINEQETVNSIVLDSSGNSLHAYVNNFTGSLRVNSALDTLNPVSNEKREFTTVLFPAYDEVKNLNASLLLTASLYDQANPNYIVKLIPKHYLLEGADDEGYFNANGNAGDAYSGSGIPGQGQKGSTHIILTFLYIWSKFFDDIKMFVDAFGTLKTVGYDLNETTPDAFLTDLIKSYGFYLPSFFNHADINKFSDDDDAGQTTQYTTGLAFKKVHSQIMRRVIVNINDFVRSKGTKHSIRSFLRSVGIDPDNSLKIREFGGNTTKQLGTSRNKRLESIPVVDFTSASIALSSPLTASRIEPGFPTPSGQFVYSNNHIVGTTNSSDGLLTSGSWSVECNYKFPPYKIDVIGNSNQSLLRMVVTGSNAYAKPGLITNIIATQKTVTEPSTITAYVRPGSAVDSPTLTLSLNLSGAGIFDGERWNISFGRKRSDEFGLNYLSSSYFLRAGKSNYGDVEEVYTTSQFFHEKKSTEANIFEVSSPLYNASGSYISIGSNQTIPTSILYPYLNNTAEVSDEARTTSFYGWTSHLRFWSKFIDVNEWKEHVRNYKSAGVSNPKVNYNFVTNVSGSFNKLRMDTFSKQPERDADNTGKIIFVDHSYNNLVMTGSAFGSGSNVVIIGDVGSYSYLSPDFDEASTDEKVRIRGLSQSSNLDENPYASIGPAYSSNESFMKEEPSDDTRLSVEFSLTDALNRDIITMFSDLDVLGDAIGRPENMFSSDYPDLDVLRDVYFNRLTENLNFRNFLEFYRWFDLSISSFIEQLIPGKTRYKGTNFVIESHMLERHKREFRHSENYLGKQQIVSADKLLLQQIVGELKKY